MRRCSLFADSWSSNPWRHRRPLRGAFWLRPPRGIPGEHSGEWASKYGSGSGRERKRERAGQSGRIVVGGAAAERGSIGRARIHYAASPTQAPRRVQSIAPIDDSVPLWPGRSCQRSRNCTGSRGDHGSSTLSAIPCSRCWNCRHSLALVPRVLTDGRFPQQRCRASLTPLCETSGCGSSRLAPRATGRGHGSDSEQGGLVPDQPRATAHSGPVRIPVEPSADHV